MPDPIFPFATRKFLRLRFVRSQPFKYSALARNHIPACPAPSSMPWSNLFPCLLQHTQKPHTSGRDGWAGEIKSTGGKPCWCLPPFKERRFPFIYLDELSPPHVLRSMATGFEGRKGPLPMLKKHSPLQLSRRCQIASASGEESDPRA